MPDVQVGARIGPYQVDAVLPGNKGGFAQVATAHRVTSAAHEVVAIKVARTDAGTSGDPDAPARALGSEVEILRVLKHPGIVHIFPVQTDERRYAYMARAVNLPNRPWYFVMEYLAGGTVEDLIRQRGALNPTLAVEIAHQVGAALDYIHTSRYAHLDIKTNNIVFRRPLAHHLPPEAVLIDFGAAQKALRRAEVEAGALMYLPPERVEVLIGNRAPESVVDKAAADVYALGITLYRMLTGDLPFRGKRDHVTTAILTAAPTHPMQINRELVKLPDLDALIMHMLEKDPLRRPGIKDVLTRLDQVVTPPRFSEMADTPRVKTVSPGWKSAALALSALVLIEGAGLGILSTQVSNMRQRSSLTSPSVESVVTEPPTAVVPAVATQAPVNTLPPASPPTRTPTVTAWPTATVAASEPEPTVMATYTPRPTATPRPRPTAAPALPTPQATQGTQP